MIQAYTIRQASTFDLERVSALEQLCFPQEEAASKEAFQERLQVYADHFWLLEVDGALVSMINGMVTNEPDLRDAMYHQAELHTEQGRWQMIFGVETHPTYQGKGYATQLMRHVIHEAKQQQRDGLVLTCKAELFPFYAQFGFENEGVSASSHGNAVWYQMRKRLISE